MSVAMRAAICFLYVVDALDGLPVECEQRVLFLFAKSVQRGENCSGGKFVACLNVIGPNVDAAMGLNLQGAEDCRGWAPPTAAP